MIELSCDLGEGPLEHERTIWPLIDAANVACGGHAGDAASMSDAVAMAARFGVILGAHPSYPDRENFGRKSMPVDRQTIAEQIWTLRDIAARQGVPLRRVKAHGALYNDAHRDRALAEVLVEAVRSVDPTMALVASSSSQMAEAARGAGMTLIREAFADRRYRADGSLVPRSERDALLSVEDAAAQAVLLDSKQSVLAQTGETIRLAFDTICIHSDMTGSVERLQLIRSRLGRG